VRTPVRLSGTAAATVWGTAARARGEKAEGLGAKPVSLDALLAFFFLFLFSPPFIRRPRRALALQSSAYLLSLA